MTIVGLAAIIVGFLLPHITPPTKPIEQGIAPAPGSPADALVIGEAESYVDEAGGEYSQDPRRSGE